MVEMIIEAEEVVIVGDTEEEEVVAGVEVAEAEEDTTTLVDSISEVEEEAETQVMGIAVEDLHTAVLLGLDLLLQDAVRLHILVDRQDALTSPHGLDHGPDQSRDLGLLHLDEDHAHHPSPLHRGIDAETAVLRQCVDEARVLQDVAVQVPHVVGVAAHHTRALVLGHLPMEAEEDDTAHQVKADVVIRAA